MKAKNKKVGFVRWLLKQEKSVDKTTWLISAPIFWIGIIGFFVRWMMLFHQFNTTGSEPSTIEVIVSMLVLAAIHISMCFYLHSGHRLFYNQYMVHRMSFNE